jgi:hypothetical protein
LADRLIEWLEKQSPDVWHIIAQRINWDFGTNVLRWIVGHPQCDRATAQRLFLENDGGWDLDSAADVNTSYQLQQKTVDSNDRGIYGTIVERWNAGGYVRSEIQSYAEFDEDGKRFLSDRAKNPEWYWPIAATIGDKIYGKPEPMLSPEMLTFELRALFAEKGSLLSFDDEVKKAEFFAWCRQNGFNSTADLWTAS